MADILRVSSQPADVASTKTPPFIPERREIGWLDALRVEVERHPAVNHLLLARLATGPYTRSDYRAFGLQHYALVGCFTKYMEMLLLRAPSSDQKLWLAKVLVDEYGEGSDGKDHTTLYAEFLRCVGASEDMKVTTRLCNAVWQFVGDHLTICRTESFLAGLGALGPGHEWAIPKMFSHIIPGLERAGVSHAERLYFDLHTEQDIDHAQWMSEALMDLARTDEDRAEVRRGALMSLAARNRLWTGIEREIVRWRQPAGDPTESPGNVLDLRSAVAAFLQGQPWPVALDGRTNR